jgi:phosphate transport system ATP-binding protein
MSRALSVRCAGLSVSWRSRVVLGPLDLEVGAGERVALLGGSGSGKTGLFQAMVRRDSYDEDLAVTGDLRINERSILSSWPLLALRRQVGFVTPFPVMLPGSVYDNVTFPLRMRGERSQSVINGVVEQALRTAKAWESVRERLSDPATDFSVGEQQRVAIARAVAQQPGLLLLDQPFALLDEGTGRAVEESLCELPDTTVILATPNERRAGRFSPRVIALSGSVEAANE